MPSNATYNLCQLSTFYKCCSLPHYLSLSNQPMSKSWVTPYSSVNACSRAFSMDMGQLYTSRFQNILCCTSLRSMPVYIAIQWMWLIVHNQWVHSKVLGIALVYFKLLCLQLATTTLAMRGCTVDWVGGNLRQTYSLVWSTIKDSDTWSQISSRYICKCETCTCICVNNNILVYTAKECNVHNNKSSENTGNPKEILICVGTLNIYCMCRICWGEHSWFY